MSHNSNIACFIFALFVWAKREVMKSNFSRNVAYSPIKNMKYLVYLYIFSLLIECFDIKQLFMLAYICNKIV